jgi:hypothetical protein
MNKKKLKDLIPDLRTHWPWCAQYAGINQEAPLVATGH